MVCFLKNQSTVNITLTPWLPATNSVYCTWKTG